MAVIPQERLIQRTEYYPVERQVTHGLQGMKQIGGVINVGAAFNHQVVSLGVTQGETYVQTGAPLPPQVVGYTAGIATGVGAAVVPPIAPVVAPVVATSTYGGYGGYQGVGVSGYQGVGVSGYGGYGGYGGVTQTPGVVTNVDVTGNVTQTPVVVTNRA